MFVNSGVADCESLQNIYGPKVEENKADSAFLKKTITILKMMKCNECEAYFKASDYLYRFPCLMLHRNTSPQCHNHLFYSTYMLHLQLQLCGRLRNCLRQELMPRKQSALMKTMANPIFCWLKCTVQIPTGVMSLH